MTLLYTKGKGVQDLIEKDKGALSAKGIGDYSTEATTQLTAFTTDDVLGEALASTGVATELIQDNIARMALEDYKGYLKYKHDMLNQIRQEVMRAYLLAIRNYKQIGYSQHEAEKKAKEIAHDTKASQMKMFNLLFPHSGQRVVNVY